MQIFKNCASLQKRNENMCNKIYTKIIQENWAKKKLEKIAEEYTDDKIQSWMR